MTIPKPNANPIEVVTSIQRRRRWVAEEKRGMVEEAEQPGGFRFPRWLENMELIPTNSSIGED